MSDIAEEWSHECDRLIEELLCEAGWREPPVEMLSLAERRGMTVIWDQQQTGRARLLRIAGRPTICLKPDDRPERLQWALAHEIGESLLWQLAPRLDLSPEACPPRLRESLANALAQRLLLPSAWWRTAVRETGGDLSALKERFSTSSHELIAWRFLDDPTPRVVTVIDQGLVVRRRANFVNRTPAPVADELAAWRAAQESGFPVTRSVDWRQPGILSAECRVWPIHEPGWQRELAITTLNIAEE